MVAINDMYYCGGHAFVSPRNLANIRCAVDRLKVRCFDGLSEVVRCRRCRMKSERAIGWKCKNCTSMWNLEWMNGIIGSVGRQNKYVCLSTRQRDHPTIFKLLDLAFCPSRMQKRGMLYSISLIKQPTEEAQQQHPFIAHLFLSTSKKRQHLMKDAGYSSDYPFLIKILLGVWYSARQHTSL
ncbi:unnamed protein product, partial [Mesorhabditis spiculigera]